ncbi:YIP1 family protein [Halopelagius fulvigenes]|uniref:YIP1 family protein n=1 Tax=Halopelagius fulvigenes TaxID=1198324 RepID=A0ABD5TXS0_9EURY
MPSTPLFEPSEFFARRSPSLSGAAIILLLAGIVAVASAAPFMDQYSPIEFSTEMLVFSVLFGGLLGAVVIWTVSTIAVYLLSALAGGSGPLSQVAANIGWALLPLLLMNTITTATIWIFASFGGLPTVTPTRMQYPSWLVLFNSVIGVVGYLWIGYLLTYAISEARNLAVRRSAVIAGLVVLFPILNALLSLL